MSSVTHEPTLYSVSSEQWHLEQYFQIRPQVFAGYAGFFNTKTGRHDIAEILLKVALNTINQSK
jgi:hypothetical protein